MQTLKKALSTDDRVQIYPGEQFVTRGDIILSTLLGSCVAACLYDPVSKVIGMNHFLLANHRYPKDMDLIQSQAGRYGIHAMELLINEMLKQGAKKHRLQAKAFGGGNVLKTSKDTPNFLCVGSVNTRFIQEFLENEKIPLVASNLGGDLGRVIHFFSSDYSVLVKKIQKTTTAEVVNKERNFWLQSINNKQAQKMDIDLWG